MRISPAVLTSVLACIVAPGLFGQGGVSIQLGTSPASGPNTTVTMTVTDTNGYDANSTAQLLISWGAWSGADGCYLTYNIQANALYLMDDS